MKTTSHYLRRILLSMCTSICMFVSCSVDELETHNEVLIVASEIVEKSEGDAYWIKRSGSTSWKMMYANIQNFNHERGYEYVVLVNVKKNNNPGPGESARKYILLKIISKEKKDSEVPLFTSDISMIKSQDEIAFPKHTLWRLR